MQNLEIPIFTKVYNLYKNVHLLRTSVPKQDRYTLWQKVESSCIELISMILQASTVTKEYKIPILESASNNLNLLRVFIRLANDTKAINNKKYTRLQANIDEIGRMLGGWIKSSKE